MRDISLIHILIFVGIIVLLFGAKKLPELSRSVGKSMRILKTEVKSLRDDDDDPVAEDRHSGASPAPQPAPAPLEGRDVDDARRAQRDEQHRAS